VHAEFATVDTTVDLLNYVAEDISLDFEQWGDRYARGPSLYFLVLSEVRFDSFVDGLGTNRWPVESARVLPEDFTAAVRVASDVAFDCDGAVVVSADGTFQERMVRVRSTPEHRIPDVEYPDWMSAKHLSAFEASTREGVLAAVTLSEESGRVTVFRGGSYEDRERDELGGRWRVDRELTVDSAPTNGSDGSRE
jgi:diadenylate cyclase